MYTTFIFIHVYYIYIYTCVLYLCLWISSSLLVMVFHEGLLGDFEAAFKTEVLPRNEDGPHRDQMTGVAELLVMAHCIMADTRVID